MLCKFPFVRDPSGKILKLGLVEGDRDKIIEGTPFPCGQCLPCRINRRRVWSARLFLESTQHFDMSFVTLTYSPEALPPGGTLVKRHLQLFIKRLRKMFPLRRIRYYGVGEYGTRYRRPHYHVLLFGVRVSEEQLNLLWPSGLVHVGDVSPESIEYVAGYVTKKYVKKDASITPEFSLMSLKPGIGSHAIPDIISALRDSPASFLFDSTGQCPSSFRVGRKLYPFGRYLIDKLHTLFGGFAGDSSDAAFLTSIRDASLNATRSGHSLLDFLLAEASPRVKQLEARHRIFTLYKGNLS